MANGLGIEMIRESYSRMPDQELLYIVSQDAHGLTAEAIEVIKEELAKRRLNVQLGEAVEAQNKIYSEEELNEYCRVMEVIPCPRCKKTDAPLTAAMVYQTMSFIFFTYHKKRLTIGCSECVLSEAGYDLGLSLFLGWWGIPWGPIKTIQTIANFVKARAAVKQRNTNDYMRSLVLSNIGLFVLHKNNPEKINIIVGNVHRNIAITTGV